MSVKTALITGALGQDGHLLATHLLESGYRVIGLSRPGTVPPSDGILSNMCCEHPDLTDAPALRQLLERTRPDEIYHLAAIHHSSQEHQTCGSLHLHEAMLSGNFLATKTLAFAMVETRIPAHLVFAASSQMFTAEIEDRTIDERSPRKPSTFYGHIKSWSMDLLTFLRAEQGLRASSAILFNHESPLRGQQFVSRKISRAAALAKLGRPVNLELHNLAARVDWLSARDVVRALHLMAAAEKAHDYVVASGQLHSVQEMLGVAFAHAGLNWQDHVNMRPGQPMPALAGCSAALREKLHWAPRRSFKNMIAEMVDYDIKNVAIPAG